MKHPAAIPRKQMKEPQPSTESEPKYVGRRTGRNFDDKIANGNGFLIENDINHLLDRNVNLMDLYSSDSSSDDNSKNLDWSDSEAEESSVKEESANESTEKTFGKATDKSKAQAKPKKDIMDLRNKLMQESEPNDYSALVNQGNQIPPSDDSSPDFNKKNKLKVPEVKFQPEPKVNVNSANNIQAKTNLKNNNANNTNNKNEKEKKETKPIPKDEEDEIELSFVSVNKGNKLITNIETERRKVMNISLSTIKKKDDNLSMIVSDNELLATRKKEQQKRESDKGREKNNINLNAGLKVKEEEYEEDIQVNNYNSFENGSLQKDKTQAAANPKQPKENKKFPVNKENKPEQKDLNKNIQVNKENNIEKKLEPKFNILKEKKNLDNKKVNSPKKVKENDGVKVKEEKENIAKSKKRKYTEFDEDHRKTEIQAIKKSKTGSKIPITESQHLKDQFNKMIEYDKLTYTRVEEEEEQQFFGVSDRYSKRIRIRRLNTLAGERLSYKNVKDPLIGTNLPSLRGVSTNNDFMEYCNTNQFIPKKKPKKRRLVKGLKKIKEEDEKEEGNNSNPDDSSDDNLPEDFSEIGEGDDDTEEIVQVPPRHQKGVCKNFQVNLRCDVLHATGKNKILYGKEEKRNLKKGDTFTIPPSLDFNFINYSQDLLTIKIKVLPSNSQV